MGKKKKRKLMDTGGADYTDPRNIIQILFCCLKRHFPALAPQLICRAQRRLYPGKAVFYPRIQLLDLLFHLRGACMTTLSD